MERADLGDPVSGADPSTLRIDANAKINLTLRVIGHRPDGYHELETLMVPISLADRLDVHADADPKRFRTLSLSLEVTGQADLIRDVPLGETNLVLAAARALAEHVEARGFAHILLEKRVPSAAGLGGGSADAAATLRALNRLWRCGLDTKALARIGAGVGSDVPALVAGQAAVAQGRGEFVRPVEAASFEWVLRIFPFGVRTADAFRWWDEDGCPSGRGDPAAVIEPVRSSDVNALGRALFNDLEEPVVRRYPEIREAKEVLVAHGAAGAVMCGSGPTVAALLPEEADVSLRGTIRVGSLSANRPGGWLAPHDSNVDLRDQNPASLPLD